MQTYYIVSMSNGRIVVLIESYFKALGLDTVAKWIKIEAENLKIVDSKIKSQT